MSKPIFINKLRKQAPLKRGQVVISSSTEGSALMILHRGQIGIFHPRIEKLKSDKVMIGMVKENSYFGWESFLTRSESFPVFKCLTDCEVSVFPCPSIEALVKQSPKVFMAVINMMNNNFNYFVSYDNGVVAMVNQLAEANFKLATLFKELNLTVDSETLDKYLALGPSNGDVLHISKFVKAVPDFKRPAARFNPHDTSFVLELFSKDLQEDVIPLLKKRPRLGQMAFDVFISEFTYIYEYLQENLGLLIEEFSVFVNADNSFLKQLKSQQSKINLAKWHRLFLSAYEHYDERFFSNKLIAQLFDVKKLRKDIFIEREEFPEVDGLPQEMREDFSDILGEEASRLEEGRVFVEDEEAHREDEKKSAKVDKMREGIDETSEMDLKDFLSDEDKYIYKRPKLTKELSDVLMGEGKKKERGDTSTDSLNKSIRMLNSIFFKGLERASAMLYIKNKESVDATNLLRHGFIDVKSLTKKQLKKFVELEDSDETEKTEYDVVSMEKWLESIAQVKDEPSNNELGFSYSKFQKNKLRFLSEKARKQLEAKTEEDKQLDRVTFEVRNLITMCYRMMNFSFGGAVPMNSMGNLPKDLDKMNFVTEAMLGELLDEIRSYDRLLFFRESLHQVSETKNYIIRMEVLPKFIIFPGVGNEVIFWQEMLETNKKSQARFVVPLIFVGNLRNSLIKALGDFRWEINRAVKGVSWMSPVDGGLTGEFIDYITFFRKNSALTFTAKEKLMKIVRNNRNNARKMFSLFYLEWLEFERKGLIRLNSVERKLLFAYAPFSKELRKNLAKTPVFRELITKHEFKMTREHDRFSKHYAYLKNEEGKFPDEVEKYLESLTF